MHREPAACQGVLQREKKKKATEDTKQKGNGQPERGVCQGENGKVKRRSCKAQERGDGNLYQWAPFMKGK